MILNLRSTLGLRSTIASMACASFALLGLATPSLAQNSLRLPFGSGADTVAKGPTVWLFEEEADAVFGYFVRGEAITAECDLDCSDVDLALLDESGEVVAFDNGLDDVPVVIAPYDGAFLVEVKMIDCSSNQGCGVSLLSEYDGFAGASSSEGDFFELLSSAVPSLEAGVDAGNR